MHSSTAIAPLEPFVAADDAGYPGVAIGCLKRRAAELYSLGQCAFMKNTFASKTIQAVVVFLAGIVGFVRAQEQQFFRLAGPVPTTISTVNVDGYITWTNEATNATFTVQVATTLDIGNIWVDYLQVSASNNSTTLHLFDLQPPEGMVLIPAGTFTMGDNLDGSYGATPTRTVYVSEFYLDKYEVTKVLWDEVFLWATNNGYSFENVGLGKASNHPVHTINWYDMVKWCNARSEREGLSPVYYTDPALTTVYRTGRTNVLNDWAKWDATGYRLPTEAEWEKAARGGVSGRRFAWGDTISWSKANYYSSIGSMPYDENTTNGHHPTFTVEPTPYTNPVGYFPPSGYGLHDMSGNILERCWDYWGSGYGALPTTDPLGMPSGQYRVIRGGSWDNGPSRLTMAFRDADRPQDAYTLYGFRTARRK